MAQDERLDTEALESSPPLLVIDARSSSWRRRVGPLAWSAFEELVLLASSFEGSWAVPIGVRGLAEILGVTKDTAGRAVGILARVGVVGQVHMRGADGRRRTGYRLYLPDGARRERWPEDHDGSDCPVRQDSEALAGFSTSRPRASDSSVRRDQDELADERRCEPPRSVIVPGNDPIERNRSTRPRSSRRHRLADDRQGRLFELDPATTADCRA